MRASGFLQLTLASAALALTAGCSQVPEQASDAPAALPSASASAPGEASRAAAGRLTIVQWPDIRIDDKTLRAAPGARIINSNNMMMTPNMVAPGARIQYELDGSGQVRLIRVLGN
jgi:hypothetical protein